jgi:hypothetical protein
MTKFKLSPKKEILVPSLGFGQKWQKARTLFSDLLQSRLEPFDETGAAGRFEKQHLLFENLFRECQSLAGNTPEEIQDLVDNHLQYSHRADYEQILFYGEPLEGPDGLKKK